MDQHQSFEERLARIGQGGGASAAPTAPASAKEAPARGKRRQAAAKPPKINDVRENIKYPAKIAGAFFIGWIGVFVARYVRFHLSGGALTGEGADTMMLLDAGMAFAVGFVLTQLFRLEAKEYKAAQTAGVVVMVAVMHNFVHWFPVTSALVFSEEWVAEVTEFTLPNSILFQGNSYVFNGEEKNYSYDYAYEDEDWAEDWDDAPSTGPTRLLMDSEK